jgi:hypothetical protein
MQFSSLQEKAMGILLLIQEAIMMDGGKFSKKIDGKKF